VAREWQPYVVRQGDHVRKLAFRAGAGAEEVWAHEKNKPLKDRRPSMDMLCPGDVVYLPQSPREGVAITAKTKNKLKARVPTMPFKMQIESKGRSVANQPYEIHGAGGSRPINGTTGGEGEIEAELPIWAREVEVRLTELGMRFTVLVGDLDPIEEQSGVAQRLQNLGYLSDGPASEERLAGAVRAFQHAAGLGVTGDVDDDTRKALRDAHLN
jgi:hypothetical protein